MVSIPWFVPHLRHVPETYEEVQEGFLIKKLKDDDNIANRVREFKDEAERPWYKFFDEYEYRETKEESSNHAWWRWYEVGTSKAEKKLLLKLDFLIAFIGFVGYWAKALDQSNISNAYVSGMKENLNLGGNDLINLQVIFNVGNIILELPFVYLLPRVNTTYLLFSCELGWSVFTIAQSRAPNVHALKAFRFFVGAFEAAFFPSIHHSFASWYKPTEVARRGALFYCGQFLGVLTSGLLQAAIFKALDGKNGLEGWRWMFVIDGCISFGVALLTLLLIPGTPFHCYSIWLTNDEIKLARKRMRNNGLDERVPTRKQIFDIKVWKNIFTSWHFWLFTIGNIGGYNSNSASTGAFALWLKSLKKYSIPQINNYTCVPPAVGIFFVLFICGGADIFKKRFIMIALAQVFNMIGNAVLAAWPSSEGAKWFGFSLGYSGWSQSSVYYTVYNDLLKRDSNSKSIEWMVSYIIAFQSSVWISRLLFPTVEAPKYHKGFTGVACFASLQIVATIISYFFYKRDEKRNAHEYGIIVYDSSKGEIPEEVLQKKVWLNDLKDGDTSDDTNISSDGEKVHEITESGFEKQSHEY